MPRSRHFYIRIDEDQLIIRTQWFLLWISDGAMNWAMLSTWWGIYLAFGRKRNAEYWQTPYRFSRSWIMGVLTDEMRYDGMKPDRSLRRERMILA